MRMRVGNATRYSVRLRSSAKAQAARDHALGTIPRDHALGTIPLCRCQSRNDNVSGCVVKVLVMFIDLRGNILFPLKLGDKTGASH